MHEKNRVDNSYDYANVTLILCRQMLLLLKGMEYKPFLLKVDIKLMHVFSICTVVSNNCMLYYLLY